MVAQFQDCFTPVVLDSNLNRLASFCELAQTRGWSFERIALGIATTSTSLSWRTMRAKRGPESRPTTGAKSIGPSAASRAPLSLIYLTAEIVRLCDKRGAGR